MKIRTDFVTNSSSSSFICIRCGRESEEYDWTPQYEANMCHSCYNDYKNEDKNETVEFITFLCKELCLDRNKILEKYNDWRN